MSYLIAKSISITDQRISAIVRSNNVYPSIYSTATMSVDRDHLRFLMEDIDGGSIQPIPSANRYKWAAMKVELGPLTSEQRLNKFIELARAKEPEGKYILITPNGYYLKKNKRSADTLTPVPEQATPLNYYEAMYLMGTKYKDYNFTMIKKQ
ncbi:MAG: hypothetical protein IJS19_00320 [Muribaculaceae bacterium]|nr:hypothetical protein [Muribaculaceae bacterium]